MEKEVPFRRVLASVGKAEDHLGSETDVLDHQSLQYMPPSSYCGKCSETQLVVQESRSGVLRAVLGINTLGRRNCLEEVTYF